MLIVSNIFLSIFFVSISVFADTSVEELHRLTRSNHQVLDYSSARKFLFNEIYLKNDSKGFFVMDVYCMDRWDLPADDVANRRLPDAKYMNTEHTWPQSKFSASFPANVQKSDLHHLYITGSKINAERGNFPFAEVNGNDRLSCTESRRGNSVGGERGSFFEPPDSHKGNVARSMFYFSVRYKINIDKTQEYFLRLWHREDPVDAEERATHEKIVKVQKNRNPFVDQPDLVLEIDNF